MTAPRISRYADTAVLIECDPAEQDIPALTAAYRHLLPSAADISAAETTILIQFDTPIVNWNHLEAELRAVNISNAPIAKPSHITLQVRYDGPDLAVVADATELSIESVVRRHTSNTYRVAFCGFAPGFAYLAGLDPALVLPRRDSPRTRVQAGSVAIAANYSAVYPRDSPGGWHLLGTCDAVLFDNNVNPPALLVPGTVVRFEPVQ